MEGRHLGRLTVIRKCERRASNREIRWECLCDCGTITITTGVKLRSGHTKSCGCLQKDRVTTHGLYMTATYKSWADMKSRCFNKNVPHYPDYGGRGITVCQRWQESFKTFYQDMGAKPEGKTLDRIDNNGNYTPDNCKWSTFSEQQQNTRCKGYYWNKQSKKWYARIGYKYKSKFLGRFNTEEEAARAYQEAKKDRDQGYLKLIQESA